MRALRKLRAPSAWLIAAAQSLMVAPAAAQQTSAGEAAAAGRTLFETRCAACHTLGSDRGVGPGLEGVTAKRDRGWLIRRSAAPDRVLAAGDTIATRLLREFNGVPMPSFGLSEAEATAIVAYLEAQPGTAAAQQVTAAAATPEPVLVPGDPVIGKGLFTGSVRFSNGGPTCMACHSVAGIGALGGGALGPDLTLAREKYGAEGLAAVLGSLPFPTMQPIFGARPLTSEEQAHLLAFLLESAPARPVRAVRQLSVLALAGAIVLLVPVGLFGRRRLTGVRRPLLGQRPR